MSNTADRRILVFAKAPIAGRVKTRLASDVGVAAALQLYKQMLAHTIQLVVDSNIPTELWVDEPGHDYFKPWADSTLLSLRRQTNGDLGDRMAAAFARAFDETNTKNKIESKTSTKVAPKIIAIGVDCPSITAEYFDQAYAALGESDCVLGPAQDGGYVLMGLRRPAPTLFEHIDWSTERVLRQTRQRAESAGLTVTEIDTLADIDRLEDLALLRADQRFSEWCC